AYPLRDVLDESRVHVVDFLVFGRGRGALPSDKEVIAPRIIPQRHPRQRAERAPPAAEVDLADLIVTLAVRDEHGTREVCRDRFGVISTQIEEVCAGHRPAKRRPYLTVGRERRGFDLLLE